MSNEPNQEVHVERRGAVLEITLDRPKVNAIDLQASRALGEAFVLLRDDPSFGWASSPARAIASSPPAGI